MLTREDVLRADKILKLLSMSQARGATPAEASAYTAKAAKLAAGYPGGLAGFLRADDSRADA